MLLRHPRLDARRHHGDLTKGHMPAPQPRHRVACNDPLVHRGDLATARRSAGVRQQTVGRRLARVILLIDGSNPRKLAPVCSTHGLHARPQRRAAARRNRPWNWGCRRSQPRWPRRHTKLAASAYRTKWQPSPRCSRDPTKRSSPVATPHRRRRHRLLPLRRNWPRLRRRRVPALTARKVGRKMPGPSRAVPPPSRPRSRPATARKMSL
jgi:hypothetical protein